MRAVLSFVPIDSALTAERDETPSVCCDLKSSGNLRGGQRRLDKL